MDPLFFSVCSGILICRVTTAKQANKFDLVFQAYKVYTAYCFLARAWLAGPSRHARKWSLPQRQGHSSLFFRKHTSCPSLFWHLYFSKAHSESLSYSFNSRQWQENLEDPSTALNNVDESNLYFSLMLNPALSVSISSSIKPSVCSVFLVLFFLFLFFLLCFFDVSWHLS